PLLFTAMPLFILNGMQGGSETANLVNGMDEMPAAFGVMCTGLTDGECAQLFIVTQFIVLFLLLPVIIPVTIAAYSIVGEKNTHTLEPLLATPIRTYELLLGKALAAVFPALGATWIGFLIFVIGTQQITQSPQLMAEILSPLWLLAILVVAPLLSVAGVSVAVMISSRVNDPRVAEQLSALVVLPILMVFMGQSFGLIQINQTVVIWFALILLILDTVLIYFAVQLFQRETILTRWK
ncbi:MAG: ABC transporter permease subunit, partial [Chloroflexota bacterium]